LTNPLLFNDFNEFPLLYAVDSSFMMPPSAPTALNGSRLVRFLSDLEIADVQVSHKHFTERLAQLIDLSDSVALSAAHDKLALMRRDAGPAASPAVSSEAVIAEFIRVRTAAVQFIVSTFTPGEGVSWLSLPIITSETPELERASYERYQLFYVNHQREIIFKLNKLRADTRSTVSTHSARLAQLVALDTALEATLNVHTQKLFAGVPRLLGKRFDALYQQHQQTMTDQETDDPQMWGEPGGWLEQFNREMQGLLLAELEVRLQAILGLIEALNEEDDRS
jgi:hypothetical protein